MGSDVESRNAAVGKRRLGPASALATRLGDYLRDRVSRKARQPFPKSPQDGPKLSQDGPQRAACDLFEAVEKDDIEAIRAAAASGVYLNIHRADGATPLARASALGRIEMVRTLLECGADASQTTFQGHTPLDFARSRQNMELEDLLLMAEARQGNATWAKDFNRCSCGTCRDLRHFISQSELILPPTGLETFIEKWSTAGTFSPAEVPKLREELKQTNYRVLFEQLFGSEALATARPAYGNGLQFRSPMILGAYDVPTAKRLNKDLVELSRAKFEITDRLLGSLLPDEIFVAKPKRFCEIGGAWGATIKHFTERFQVEAYHNYEPDAFYARWAEERFGVTKMPVDGETLSGTENDSIDLVIANNVLIFVPPIKLWSYLTEMRRVLRKDGTIVFNAIISDQLTEEDMRKYLDNFFPNRTIQIFPRDLLDRTFPEPQFQILKIVDREYFVIRRLQ